METKVTTIQEAKDLRTLKIEDLLRSLKVHEIELRKDEEGLKKQKIVALKAKGMKTSRAESSIEGWRLSDDDSDE